VPLGPSGEPLEPDPPVLAGAPLPRPAGLVVLAPVPEPPDPPEPVPVLEPAALLPRGIGELPKVPGLVAGEVSLAPPQRSSPIGQVVRAVDPLGVLVTVAVAGGGVLTMTGDVVPAPADARTAGCDCAVRCLGASAG
jgi:hypothetical protein